MQPTSVHTTREPDVLLALQQLARLIARERDRDVLLRGAAALVVDVLGETACRIELAGRAGDAPAYEAGTPDALAQLRTCCVGEDVDCPIGAVAVAIEHAGRRLGRLAIVPNPHHASDAWSHGLFADFGADLGFALHALGLEALANADDAREAEREARHRDELERIAKHLPGVLFTFNVRADGSSYASFVSDGAREEFGVAQDAFAGGLDAWTARLHPDDRARVWEEIGARVAARETWHDVFRFEHPTRGIRWLEAWSAPSRDEDESPAWHGFVADVTDTRRDLDREDSLSRLYRALGAVNEGIARAREEDALFQQVCDAVNVLGGIRVVALYMRDEAGHALALRAHAAPIASGSLLPRTLSLADDAREAATLTVTALRLDRTQVLGSLAGASPYLSASALAATGRVQSLVAVPLRRSGVAVGVLAIGAAEPSAFDDEMVRLVETMADNVSAGLEHLARERELHENDARFREVFELAPVGIAWLDTISGRYLRVNPRLAEMLGYTQEELCGRTWIELTHPDDRERDRARARPFVEGEIASLTTLERFVRKDGATVWASVGAAAADRTAGGRVKHHVAVIEDVTARREAELALRASEERYRALVDGMDDVAFDSAPDGTMRFLSRSVARWGYRPEDLVGRSFKELIHPDDREGVAAARARAMASGEPASFEYRLVGRDGRLHRVRVMAHAVQEAGRPAGMIGVLRDVTRQHETEEQLRLAQKMEAIGHLAGGVAHDFNNMLSIIGAYAELGMDALRPGDPLHHDLGQIRAAAKSAEGLTRQLLIFSRQKVEAPARLDLDVLIGQVERMLARVLGEDVALSFAPSRRGPIVEADAGGLEQALTNLAINARDAMPEGGRLTIETAIVDADDVPVAAARGGGAATFVRLTVTDTGLGMDEATRARIFEPFFTTKPAGKGTGLGLSMVYGVVQQSGGTIEARSTEPTAPHATPAVRRDETVLLVDDDAPVRALARRILESAGYQVLAAANAAEAGAFCAAAERRIDLLVSNLGTPGVDGTQLAERALAMRPSLKILFVSGYAHEPLSTGLVAGRPVALLAKPFDAESLTRKVRAVLDDRDGR
jgi:PAS domain S-box-containing protein